MHEVISCNRYSFKIYLQVFKLDGWKMGTDDHLLFSAHKYELNFYEIANVMEKGSNFTLIK